MAIGAVVRGCELPADRRRRYDGAWVDGEPHGTGTFTEESGMYEGEFSSGLKHGNGVMNFSCGDQYTGQVGAGAVCGFSRFRSRVTSGLLAHFTGTAFTCVGTDPVTAGRGCMGTRAREYCGVLWWCECAVRLMHGKGVYLWPTGAMYDGSWEAGMKHGQGSMVYSVCRRGCVATSRGNHVLCARTAQRMTGSGDAM